jgi:lipopolysaccharide export LptBFGC system permease protein LptF
MLHLNTFLSLALTFAMVRVIYRMNSQNELTALQMAGISKYKLSMPIFFVAFTLSSLSYLNFEILSPTSFKAIENFKNSHIRKKIKRKKTISHIILNDKTTLIYQSYDNFNKTLFDVFWIKSKDDIWYIKYLDLKTKPPQGSFVDHMKRNDQNKLVKIESFKSYAFFQMHIEEKIEKALIPFNARPISTLLSQKKYSSLKEKAVILSNLNYKLAMPLLPILIVLSVFPFCLKFSRNNKGFLILSLSLFGLISFLAFMDSFHILAENQVGSPIFIIWLPFLFCFALFGIKFLKT